MKRTLVFLLALLLLIGCQKTPEQPLIVPKDQELMLEKAAATQAPAEAYTPPAAPERWTFDHGDGNFVIHADADVAVPDVPLPTVWLRAEGLPQETVYRLFRLLSQGEELKLPHVQTRAEIEESIRAYTELLEQGPDQDADMSKEEYDEGLLQELEYLKEAYKTAPETSPDRVSDGTYEVEKSGKTGTDMLVLSASNLNREISARAFPQADERSSFAYYRHLRGRSDYSMANARRMEAAALQDDPLFEKAMGEVQAVLAAIGDPFEVAALYLIDDAAYGNVDGIVHDAEHRALCVDCRRLVHGAPVAYDVSGAARKDPKSYAIPWPVESLRLVVDVEGIVSLTWKNMVTVLETASPVTNLLPFEQTAAVAEKMLPILYNPTGWEDLRSVDIDISHVGLELIRIREQNNTTELKGLLVPAWAFYGTIRMTEASGFQDYANYGLKSGYDHYRGEEILLCLNAVDGSVIDPLLGYLGDEYMKKICIYILIFLLVCVGCQPTPETPAVIRKDQSAMLKKAGEPMPADALARPLGERLGVPGKLSYTYQKDALTIDADAIIVVPEGETPIVRVFPTDFDQATVSRLWKALVGDVPMTAVQDQRTKEYYAPLIELALQALESDDPQKYGFDSREDAQRRLESLQKQYVEAPDAPAVIAADGTLQQGAYLDDEGQTAATYTYIKAESAQTGYRFIVRNNGSNAEPIQTTMYDAAGKAMGFSLRRVERNAYFSFIKGNEPQAACFVWDRELDWDADCPPEAAGSLSIPPRQAVAAAARFLEEAGLAEEYRVWRVFLITDWPEGDESCTYAYRVVCSRLVNGCPTLMAGNLVEESDDAFAPNWRSEKLYVDVNDQDLYCVQLTSPLTVGDTMIDRANLMPFSEIRSIMEKMLPILYEEQASSFEEGVRTTYEKHIRRVELGLWCIREMDQLNQGILIPAWAFYANTREVNEDGEAWCSFEPILLVNAVDGSVIDPLLGY